MVVYPMSQISLTNGFYVCANKIKSIMDSEKSFVKKMKKAAMEVGRYLDYTNGKPTKSIILLDDDTMLGVSITARDVSNRCNRALNYNWIMGLQLEKEMRGLVVKDKAKPTPTTFQYDVPPLPEDEEDE